MPRAHPETRFAWNGVDALAYQVLGDRATDLVYLQGWISNVELNWDHPAVSGFLTSLARSRRLIVTDPRGVGCSERSSAREPWPLELVTEDLRLILDAVGSVSATILASNECAFAACMFAATHPDRTAGLILYEASARWLWSEETPWEWTIERWRESWEHEADWTRETAKRAIRSAAPSMAGNEPYLEWWYRYCLLSAAPGYNRAAGARYMETDIRAILPAIRVPVLVLVRPDHPEASWVPSATHLASMIPGARLVDLPGHDAPLWLGGQRELLAAIDRFFVEVGQERGEKERVLKTILVTDIADSTRAASRLGDRAWRDLLNRHHTTVRALLGRFSGVEVDTAGDGFLATFDGPARAIRCGQAIVQSIRHLGIQVRVGVHTGECEVIDGKVGGIAVNISARVAALAQPSEVLVSQTVRDLVAGSGLVFEDRGRHTLKGVTGEWTLHQALAPTSQPGE